MSSQDSNPAAAAVEGTTSADVNANSASSTPDSTPPAAQGQPADQTGETDPGKLAAQAPVTPAYTPNYKYKAALQEKELDEFWRPLVKDADSEKKVKAIFSKVDAFDFVNQKREHFEKEYNSVMTDYSNLGGTVTKFNQAVKENDLSSAFRVAGITRDQVFQWTQQQLAIMEMPPDQRQAYEQAEQTRIQKSALEQEVSQLRSQYEDQAVQTRTMRLETTLLRPEVASFAQNWDQTTEPGAFREMVIQEARRLWYETKQDVAPEQAVQMVMQRFGKFVNAGNIAQPPQAVLSHQTRQAPPVIPNVAGKAASPIKKVAKSLDDIRKAAREVSMQD